MFTRVSGAPSKLTYLDESTPQSQEPTPKIFRSTNKVGKRLTKTDLARIKKKISMFMKQSVMDLKNEDTQDRDTEHKVVFDCLI